MKRGDVLSIKEKDLNTILSFDHIGPNSSEEEWDEYYDYVDTDLFRSRFFRIKCMQAGFRLVELYPVYHQGCELDEWGAIGTKDGKTYFLETNHGGLYPVEMVKTSFQKLLEKFGAIVRNFTGGK